MARFVRIDSFGAPNPGLFLAKYHWGQKITYLAFIPDELFLVIPGVLCVRKRNSRGARIQLLDKITLPKSVSNYLGNVFVPNGIRPRKPNALMCQHMRSRPRGVFL